MLHSQISILRHHIYKAVELGVNFNELCRRTGVSPEELAEGEQLQEFAPGGKHDFWVHALELTQDECIGLHMGERPDKLNPFGMLGMLIANSKTVYDGLKALTQFNDTVATTFAYKVVEHGNEVSLTLTPHPLWELAHLEGARQAVDISMASLLTRFHEFALRKIYPLRVELTYMARHTSEYKRIFQAPVYFSRGTNQMVFSQSDLQTPFMSFDQNLLNVFRNFLLEKREKLKSSSSTTAQIKNIIMTHFNGQITSIEIIASILSTTPRTLQRKLADEGTTYRQLSNELRNELADTLIRTGTSNRSQIARMLGYADKSSFYKAFKKWKA